MTQNIPDVGAIVLAPVRYWLELRRGTFEVRELRGEEGVSRPFRFETRMRVADELGSVDPDEVAGYKAFLRMERGGEVVRRLRAIVTEAAVSATASGTPEMRFVIEPALVRTRYKSDARVFRNQSVPAIVNEVLNLAGVKAAFRLKESYPARPYCVQYDESDYAFIARLCEDEGIFFAFADDLHGNFDGDDGTLYFADAASAYDFIAGDPLVPFRPGAALNRAKEIVRSLGRRASLAASKVTLRDFNPELPSVDMDVSAAGPWQNVAELYDFPGKYRVPAEGQRKAELMAEALRCAASLVTAESDVARLRPGAKFTLLDGSAEVPDGDYAVVSLAHRFERDKDSYAVKMEALEAATSYRPPRVTPVPRIVNPLVAYVTGPVGADIHTDPLGRVKIHFPWDRRQGKDDQASHWVPVLQDNTGSSFAIPRVGWEVLVHFAEGDPDKPVVLGRLYNPEEPFPEPLPEGKTRSTFKSLVSPSRDGSNEIRMDDLAGKERVYMQAEKDQNIVVANDKKENVLNTEHVNIAGNETLAVGNDQVVVVGQDHSLTVEGSEAILIKGSRTRSVGKAETLNVKGTHSLTVAGSHMRRIATKDALSVKSLRETVGALDLEASLKGNSTSAGYAETLTVGGALVELALKDKNETCALIRAETIGGLLCSKSGLALGIRSDGPRATSVGGAMMVTGTAGVLIKGTAGFELTSAARIAFDAASSITLKAGDCVVSIVDKKVSLETAGKITIEGKASMGLDSAEAQLQP